MEIRKIVKNLKGRFIKVSKEMVSGENSLINTIDEKILLIWANLKRYENSEGVARFTINDLIIKCGLKPNNNKGRTNDKFKELLFKLYELEYITGMSKDIREAKASELIEVSLKDFDKNYFKLDLEELEKIIDSNTIMSNANLLKLFCNIKSRIYKRKSDSEIIEGKYEVCFPTYRMISNETGISENNIKKYLDKLVELNLIRYKKSGTIIDKDTGKVQEGANTYALCNANSEEEINGSIGLYKKKEREKGNTFRKSKLSNDVKKLGGKKGAIIKKINSGKANDDDYKELERIEDKLAKLRADKKSEKGIKKVHIIKEETVFDILKKEDLARVSKENQEREKRVSEINADIANKMKKAIKVSVSIAMDKCIKKEFDLDKLLDEEIDIDDNFLLGLISSECDIEG